MCSDLISLSDVFHPAFEWHSSSSNCHHNRNHKHNHNDDISTSTTRHEDSNYTPKPSQFTILNQIASDSDYFKEVSQLSVKVELADVILYFNNTTIGPCFWPLHKVIICKRFKSLYDNITTTTTTTTTKTKTFNPRDSAYFKNEEKLLEEIKLNLSSILMERRVLDSSDIDSHISTVSFVSGDIFLSEIADSSYLNIIMKVLINYMYGDIFNEDEVKELFDKSDSIRYSLCPNNMMKSDSDLFLFLLLEIIWILHSINFSNSLIKKIVLVCEKYLNPNIIVRILLEKNKLVECVYLRYILTKFIVHNYDLVVLMIENNDNGESNHKKISAKMLSHLLSENTIRKIQKTD